MSVVNRGDPYILEVSATVAVVMDRLGHKNPYRLAWQSQVGPSAWIGPQTRDALKGLARLGKKRVVVVPIAFTSDHIETLYELDLEYGKEAREVRASSPSCPVPIAVTDKKTMRGQLGMEVHRAESLNGSPVFIRALADIVAHHLEENDAGAPPTSVQMGLRCPGCSNVTCAQQKSFFARGGNA
jgi:protoporphyrin/coproporphyrin ferrochelatase